MVNEIVWLVLNIFFEARGEPQEGQIAVGHVTLNRVEKHDTSIEQVVRKPYQFSWLNNPEQSDIEIKDVPELIQCTKSAIACFTQRLKGKDLWQADHYFNPYKVRPNWAREMKKVFSIGHHDFYRS